VILLRSGVEGVIARWRLLRPSILDRSGAVRIRGKVQGLHGLPGLLDPVKRVGSLRIPGFPWESGRRSKDLQPLMVESRWILRRWKQGVDLPGAWTEKDATFALFRRVIPKSGTD